MTTRLSSTNEAATKVDDSGAYPAHLVALPCCNCRVPVSLFWLLHMKDRVYRTDTTQAANVCSSQSVFDAERISRSLFVVKFYINSTRRLRPDHSQALTTQSLDGSLKFSIACPSHFGFVDLGCEGYLCCSSLPHSGCILQHSPAGSPLTRCPLLRRRKDSSCHESFLAVQAKYAAVLCHWPTWHVCAFMISFTVYVGKHSFPGPMGVACRSCLNDGTS